MSAALDSLLDTLERQLVAGIPRYRRRRRHQGLALGLLATASVVLVLVALVASRGGHVEGSVETIDRPPTVETLPVAPPPAVPSQSAADAARDLVIPEIALLTLAERVRLPLGGGGADVHELATPEGRWVISTRPRTSTNPSACFGDRAGIQGIDFVCNYTEILLLDADGRIRRAYPFENLPIRELVLGDDAVYCGRQGDGGIPDSL
jgi:hypothetical protein